jgi:hypothetical protein
MRRAYHIGVVLLLAAGFAPCEQKAGKMAKMPPAGRGMAVRPNGGGRGVPKAPPKGGNGGNLAEQLLKMPPEARERALEKLPPQMQQRLRERFEKFDSLPPAEQQRQLRDLERFSNLPPDIQAQVRRDRQAMNNLPEERIRLVRREYRRLSLMSDADRRARIASDEFKNTYTPSEQQILANLSEVVPVIPNR